MLLLLVSGERSQKEVESGMGVGGGPPDMAETGRWVGKVGIRGSFLRKRAFGTEMDGVGIPYRKDCEPPRAGLGCDGMGC